ncbi:MAG TPA: alanine racemase, partial [Actinomycetes bacterium]|nr:alanine racemase [Actinomycetes bacterium]
GVMAVVKADGYGHGLVQSATAALAGGATWLGVALVEEAMQLRQAGIDQPILAWLVGPGEQWQEAIESSVDLSLNAPWAVEQVRSAAARAGRVARVQLKVDTGLGRGGAPRDAWPDLVDAARKAEIDGLVQVVGIWSHLAYADAPGHPTIDRQLSAFTSALAEADKAGLKPDVRHLANSAATLTRPDTLFDLARPGLAVYGLSPIPQESTAEQLQLQPAMSLRARFSLVKRVPAGHGVSYMHKYVTKKETTLGLVPLGYADGIPRNATNVGPVLAAGGRRTIAGTVCMDQFVLDLDDSAVSEGDEVVLFGSAAAGEPTADDWASATGTISYEIVTRIGPRVHRRYIAKSLSDAGGEAQ